jgi:hypothetical protein
MVNSLVVCILNKGISMTGSLAKVSEKKNVSFIKTVQRCHALTISG